MFWYHLREYAAFPDNAGKEGSNSFYNFSISFKNSYQLKAKNRNEFQGVKSMSMCLYVLPVKFSKMFLISRSEQHFSNIFPNNIMMKM